jgi:hypothetical protein
MSVDQKDTIDFLSRSRVTGDVTLTISDHLAWDQPREHIFILQEKINFYLAYIESGQILEACAEADDSRIIIQVMFRCAPPDGEVTRFLATAREKIAAIGYHFTHFVPDLESEEQQV